MMRRTSPSVAAPRPPLRGRRGFTLVEGLIAVVLGAVIFGGAMSMLSFGNRAFTKTTEHSAFRAEAMLVIEKVGEDLASLVVAPEGDNPLQPGTPSLLSPVLFTGNTIPYTKPDPENPGERIDVAAEYGVKVTDGITFFRYDHIKMDTSVPDAPPGGMPVIVGRKVVYESRARADGQGFDLYRNEEKLNEQPLDQVVFHSELPIVTAHQVKGSPHAIITVKVVPKGGLRGTHFGATKEGMAEKILENLRDRGALVEKTFHLVEYESMYTTYLYSALTRIQQHFANNDIDFTSDNIAGRYGEALDPNGVESAVFQDAYLDPVNAAPAELRTRIEKAMKGGGAMVQISSKAMFALEDTPFDPGGESAFTDPVWKAATSLATEEESVAALEQSAAQQAAGEAATEGGGAGGTGGGGNAGSGNNNGGGNAGSGNNNAGSGNAN